jgi:hypothetical protein
VYFPYFYPVNVSFLGRRQMLVLVEFAVESPEPVLYTHGLIPAGLMPHSFLASRLFFCQSICLRQLALSDRVDWLFAMLCRFWAEAELYPVCCLQKLKKLTTMNFDVYNAAAGIGCR